MDGFKGKRVLVIGMGVSGKAAKKTLETLKAEVFTYDDREGESLGQVLSREYDLAVCSPGVPLSHKVIGALKEKGIPVIGEIEFAFRLLKGQKVVGVTGTNGKTTTVLLIAHLLAQKGVDARALGNVGTPLSQEVLNLPKEAVLVLELSSYQLEYIDTPALSSGVLLNLTPDHLERHKTMENYAAAKLKMGRLISSGNFFVEETVAKTYSKMAEGIDYQIFGESDEAPFRLTSQGIHDENVASIFPIRYREYKKFHRDTLLAAYLLTKDYAFTPEEFSKGLRTFSFPPHRLELAGQVDGVSFYNDSKATNVASTKFAINALSSPLLLIAGGVDKGGGYEELSPLVKERVKGLFLIGEAKEVMAKAFEGDVPITFCLDLQEAVKKAYKQGEKGDAVILSPACASFDMFKNYEERGRAFLQVVKQLEKGKEDENEP